MPPAFASSGLMFRKETAVHEIAVQRQCLTDPAAEAVGESARASRSVRSTSRQTRRWSPRRLPPCAMESATPAWVCRRRFHGECMLLRRNGLRAFHRPCSRHDTGTSSVVRAGTSTVTLNPRFCLPPRKCSPSTIKTGARDRQKSVTNCQLFGLSRKSACQSAGAYAPRRWCRETPRNRLAAPWVPPPLRTETAKTSAFLNACNRFATCRHEKIRIWCESYVYPWFVPEDEDKADDHRGQ